MLLDISVQLQSQDWKKSLRPYCKTVRMACESAIADSHIAGNGEWEMAVVLADDAFVRRLNKSFRGFDKPTNVLSFPSGDLPPTLTLPLEGGGNGALGDVILAFETVQREALEQQKSFRHHAIHLLVHGTLHLLGYDHEKKAQASKMEKLEIEILKKLGLSNPYL